MSQLVCNGAIMSCTFGLAPATLVVAPKDVSIGDQPAANIQDFAPMTNISPFGMCTSLANPVVAAATAAALGVLTPMPCIPAVTAPWVPGSSLVTIDGAPAVDATCTCLCMWGGLITVVDPGQVTVND